MWSEIIGVVFLINAFAVRAQENVTDIPEENVDISEVDENGKARNGIPLPPEIANIISPGNQDCKTSTGKVGTCDWPSSCTTKGGIASGNCLGGLQVCCLISKTCDSTTSYNNTYFVPDTTKQLDKCSIQIIKPSADVCQIRLQFDEFTLLDAENGLCKKHKFSVFGVQKVPDICGKNDGHHMILDVKSVDSPIVLMVASSETTVRANHSIRIVHIPCADTANLAPKNCLQYMTSPEGTIKPFNIMGTGSNLDYNICVKVPEGKRVCFDNCTPNTVPPPLGVFDEVCINKFWLLPCLSKKTSARSSCEHNKYCGLALPEPHCSNDPNGRFRVVSQGATVQGDCFKYTLD